MNNTAGLMLEEFGAPTRRPRDRSAGEAELAEAQLEAFDKGYREGWEDASRAHFEEQEVIKADLARAFDDMGFTYHEARAAMLREMRSLIVGLVDRVFPAGISQALGSVILEQVEALIKERSEVTVEVSVAPENHSQVEAHLGGHGTFPVKICEEPSLGPGQAVLRFGEAEEMVDLDAVLEGIRAAVVSFFADEQNEEIDT